MKVWRHFCAEQQQSRVTSLQSINFWKWQPERSARRTAVMTAGLSSLQVWQLARLCISFYVLGQLNPAGLWSSVCWAAVTEAAVSTGAKFRLFLLAADCSRCRLSVCWSIELPCVHHALCYLAVAVYKSWVIQRVIFCLNMRNKTVFITINIQHS